MTDENNKIKFFLYENWARTKTGQHTVDRFVDKPCHGLPLPEERSLTSDGHLYA